MKTPIEIAFPIGCFVSAYYKRADDELSQMWSGIVIAHNPEESYLTVQFSSRSATDQPPSRFTRGNCADFAYDDIDPDNTDDSMVVYQFEGGLANNLPV